MLILYTQFYDMAVFENILTVLITFFLECCSQCLKRPCFWLLEFCGWKYNKYKFMTHELGCNNPATYIFTKLELVLVI